MADVIVPVSKKLKQARLSFGSPKNSGSDGNKENITNHQKMILSGKLNKSNLSSTENISTEEEINFKSLSNSKKSSHSITVKADVHTTIQCPEVSTSINLEVGEDNTEKNCSMIESTMEDNEVIDLLSDPECEALQEATQSAMSDEVARNIDNAINAAVARSLNDKEGLMASLAAKDSKKRRRSKSPAAHSSGISDISNSPAVDQEKLLTNSNQHPNVACYSSDTENKPKKPRRSVLELLQTSPAIKPSIKVSPPTDGPPEKSETNSGTDVEMIVIDSTPETEEGLSENKIAKEEATGTPSKTSNLNDPADSSDKVSSESSATLNTAKTPNAKQRSPTQKPRSSKKSKEAMNQEKEEKRRLKEEEKHQKEMEKLEQKKKKEEERAIREEEKRKMKEDIERLKEERMKKKLEEQEKKKAEMEVKRLEKEQKDEEKQREKEAKEAERLKKEEEKQKVEEEKKRIKEKQACAFKSFFKPSPTEKKVQIPRVTTGHFVQFQLKKGMVLAPVVRHKLACSNVEKLDVLMGKQENFSYIDDLRSGVKPFRKENATIPNNSKTRLSLSDDGLEIVQIDESSCSRRSVFKRKLLQFTENNRPPYYGTWRKLSKDIKPKNPFAKDEGQLDYEVDSDDEWEDPGEGEDIANSDGEEETEKDEDDEEDGFFVPHGYLSDDEGLDADGEGSEELSEQKLKMKQQEFENSFKQRVKALKPVVVGCVWPDVQDSFQKSQLELLQQFEVMTFVDTPIDFEPPQVTNSSQGGNEATPKASKQPRNVPEEALPDLIRMVHGNPHSAAKLVKEFQAYWRMKNTNELPHNAGPVDENENSSNSNAMDTSVDPSDSEVAQITSSHPSANTSPAKSSLAPTPEPQGASPRVVKSRDASPSRSSSLADVTIFTPQEKGPFWIPKSQLMRKMKEIGVYGRRDNLSRSCWFVLDEVFDKYSLDHEKFPVPCRWRYVTKVPEIKFVALPEIPTSTGAPAASPATPAGAELPPKEPPVTKPVAIPSISKFTTKVSAQDLLEQSMQKDKMEKEKQAQQEQSVAAISQFATTKVSPEDLIESSRRKMAASEDSSRRVELTTIALASPQSQPWNTEPVNEGNAPHGCFGLPTHAAFKTFFDKKPAQKAESKGSSRVSLNFAATPSAENKVPEPINSGKDALNPTAPPVDDANSGVMETE